MPLIEKYNSTLSVLKLWKISETEEELFKDLNLSESANLKLNKLKPQQLRKQFLSVQHLLKILKIKNEDLHYNKEGKPLFFSKKFISISHSFSYSGIVVSNNKVGLDIEKVRTKISNIYTKFISDLELKLIAELSIENLTKVWTIKEAVFKAFGYSGIDFKKNINIESICDKFKKGRVKVFKNEVTEYYTFEIIIFSKYICTITKLDQ